MKKLLFTAILSTFILNLFIINTPIANACSYIFQTPEEKFAEADAVFLGKVVLVEPWGISAAPLQNGDTSTTITRFDVSKYWKGNISKGMSVYSSHLVGSSCESFSGQVGEDYLVYADYSVEYNRYEVTEVGPARALDAESIIESLGVGRTPETDLDKYMIKYYFAKNLSFGMTGSDVLSLQKYLNSRGFTVSSVGAGSPGNETSYFGYATRSALIKFQLANNISPAVGFFGPITRGIVNK